MARLCLGLKDSSSELLACTALIKTKITSLTPGLEGEDIIKYVVFLANKSHKNKAEMTKALDCVFDEKTEELVDWLWNELRKGLEKPKNSGFRSLRRSSDASEDGPVSEPLEKKRRCRYWPNCIRKDCQYHHPSVTCPHFPQCKFGNKCLLVHPDCKFGENCTKPNCPFTHRNKKENSRAEEEN